MTSRTSRSVSASPRCKAAGPSCTASTSNPSSVKNSRIMSARFTSSSTTKMRCTDAPFCPRYPANVPLVATATRRRVSILADIYLRLGIAVSEFYGAWASPTQRRHRTSPVIYRGRQIAEVLRRSTREPHCASTSAYLCPCPGTGTQLRTNSRIGGDALLITVEAVSARRSARRYGTGP